MLSAKKLKAFLPTTHPDKAKAFYQNVLGLKLLSEDNYALEFDVNGTSLRITVVETFTPYSFTVLGWEVDDIRSMIRRLTEKGVVFERYNFLKQDDLGIWTSPSGAEVAWFKDPDNNLLSLTEQK
jgi:catechol 2,3-dioxygenase-like lactoylglutathione lyase family enzyme